MKKSLILLVLAALWGGVNLQAKTVLLPTDNGFLDASAKIFVHMWGGSSTTNWDKKSETSYTSITIDNKSFRAYDVNTSTGIILVRCNPSNDNWDWGQSKNISVGSGDYFIITPSYDNETEATTVSFTVDATATVYYLGERKNAYVWSSYSNNVSDTWPGTSLTTVGSLNGSDVKKWTYTGNLTNTLKVKFANGDGDESSEFNLANNTLYYDSEAAASVTIEDGTDFNVPTLANTLTVYYKRNFTADQKATVCLPFALTAEQVEAAGEFYKLTGFDSQTLRFTKQTTTEAYVPYYFVPKATGATFDGITGITLTETPATIGTTVDTDVKFVGTMANVPNVAEEAGSGNTVFGFSGGDFVKVTGTVAVKPFRAYIVVPNSKIDSSAKLGVAFDDETGIQSIDRETENNVYYDLQGRRVENPAKGIFIVNGKKVVK